MKKQLHFKIDCAILDKSTRSIGQVVKTPPSHGGNRGSTPLSTVFHFPQELLFKRFLGVFFCLIIMQAIKKAIKGN